MTTPKPANLGGRALALIACLAFVAVLANMDRFALGSAGPLRAHDLSDSTITRLAGCGELWRSSLSSGWDAGRLRGWPLVSGDYHPQLLMCMVGGAVERVWIGPILHTVLLLVIAIGTFLFVRSFLDRREDVAVSGALLYVSLYFFFHEHPMVASAILLPPLTGFLSVSGSGSGWRVLKWTGTALVVMLANPTATLFAMPLGHLALILAAPRPQRRRHLVACTTFWFLYALYYCPTLVTQLREFTNATRSLYRPVAGIVSYQAILQELLVNPAVLSPAAVLVMLVGPRTWRRTLLLILLVIGGVALAAANQVLLRSDVVERFPALVSVSTAYYRMYYFVPVGLLLWATWLWHHDESPTLQLRVWRAFALGIFCWFVAYPVSGLSHVFGAFWRYALVLGLTMGFGLSWWTRRTWTIVLMAAGVILFSRYEYTRIYEVPTQGNLFVEEPHFGLPGRLSRTVTVMPGCDAVDAFPAQAAAAGEETLDGISNYYDRSFAERWRYFVNDNPALCTGRYAGWPTRAEITVDDLTYSSDRILRWLWINNVEFVRSLKALDLPELELINQRDFVVDGYRPVTRYLYRLRSTVGRVFTLPESVAARLIAGDFADEERGINALAAAGEPATVPAEAISGSHLRIAGSFGADRRIVASVNFHRGWMLTVDGQAVPGRATAGPFGMVSFQPVPGTHTYDLRFESSTTPWVPACMLAALLLLWVTSGEALTRRMRGTVEPGVAPRRAVVRWILAGVILAATGAAAAVMLRRRVAPPILPWFNDAWSHRLRLRTAGAGQTAPIAQFPLRVECTASDSHFWTAVGPEGRDIRFTDAAGQQLPFEIEEFDASGKRLVAWVRIPTLETGPQTVAYLYYGNPAAAASAGADAVWDPHYEAVWHMNPRSRREGHDVTDSTRHAHHGVVTGTRLADTEDARGLRFDGQVDSAVMVPDWPGWHSDGADWTVEFWIQPAPLNKRNFGLLDYGTGLFHLYLHNGGFLVLERRNATGLTETSLAAARLEPSAWTAVTMTRTRQHLRLALDGVAGSVYPVTPEFRDGSAVAPLRIGAGPHGVFDGRLEELRISRDVARSPDWILASFKARAESFIERGSAEGRP